MRKTKLFIKIICVLILILSTALLSACSASTSDSAEKYIVLIGEDPEITEKLSDIDLLVIDAEYFSQNDIARLRENGIHEIYSYINIGSIESFRSYDTDFEKYTLGAYENWPEEKWIDVSAPEWQACTASRVDALVQKDVDGFFVDNTDVYYNYPQESIYDGILDDSGLYKPYRQKDHDQRWGLFCKKISYNRKKRSHRWGKPGERFYCV